MKIKNLLFYAAALILLTIFSACTTPKKHEHPSVFYPKQPDLPRIQYLRSYVGSMDIEEEKSVFDVFITGEKNTGRRLDKPYGVAMYEGKIYVCDTNATVMVFDLVNKKFAPLQGAQGLGKLIQPINISIDKDGNKYVADPIRAQVIMFDKKDFYVKTFGVTSEWKPVDAVAYENRLYVVDIKNSEIKVFNKESGELVKRIGQQGTANDRLVQPTNIAFDREGYIYVSDAGRFQVVKFDRDGHLKDTIGKLGINLGHFARPRGLAVDREGYVYAVDAAFEHVQIFKDNQLILFFGGSGKALGDLFLPAKVAIDYDNIKYFEQYVDPNFEAESIILVTSQFGDQMVNVYAYGKEKGKKYPTDEELKKMIEERLKKEAEEKPKEAEEKPEEGEKGKAAEGKK